MGTEATAVHVLHACVSAGLDTNHTQCARAHDNQAHFFSIVPLHEVRSRQLAYLRISRDLLRVSGLLPPGGHGGGVRMARGGTDGSRTAAQTETPADAAELPVLGT